MLSVEAAQKIILKFSDPLPSKKVTLGPEALGIILTEDVASDIDMPPYDKAMMDGYAVRSTDVANGLATLRVMEEIPAGRTPTIALDPGQCSRIMTGAPIPLGSDSVVMLERTTTVAPGEVRIEDKPVKPGQNVLFRGREMKSGEIILCRGNRLQAQEMGLLATVGRTTVQAIPFPHVAILSTGDELVEPSNKPLAGQIRNSNGPMLAAQVTQGGAVPEYLGIAPDQLDALRLLVHKGLERPFLILSGGVSAGKLDLVPGVLQESGVIAQFHKVEMKPGKPVFFGTLEHPDRPRTLVFGLPGNPVSAFVCFELFVMPAIRRRMGVMDVGPRTVKASLSHEHALRTDRPTYYPGQLTSTLEGWTVRAIPWFGSPDLRGLVQANSLIVFPAGDHLYSAGSLCTVIPLID